MIILTTDRETCVTDVTPRRVQITAAAAVLRSAEARLLGRQRDCDRPVAVNAQTIRGSLRRTERPAASARGLITNIADNFGAVRPVGLGVKALGNLQVLIPLVHGDLASQH